jgi:hypothetical protein
MSFRSALVIAEAPSKAAKVSRHGDFLLGYRSHLHILQSLTAYVRVGLDVAYRRGQSSLQSGEKP